MLSGFYTIASGVLTKEREIDTIGNNLVNINTPGYKAERAITSTFEQELAIRLEGNNVTNLADSMATSVIISDIQTIFSDGLMKETNRTLDVSISGEGFFEITGDDGQQYLTRNGQFDIDAEGYLILPSIGRVQGTNGDLNVGTDKITINSQGEITTLEGVNIGTLSIITPTENSELTKYQNNMYSLADGELVDATGELIQGVIELSNVDMNLEMTKLIEAQRGFQNCSSALQIMDALNSKSLSQVGGVS